MVRSLDVDNSTLTCREREYYLYIMTERKRQFNMDSRGEGESVVSKKEIGDAMFLLSRMYEGFEITDIRKLTKEERDEADKSFRESIFNRPPFSIDKRGVIDKENIAKTRKTINAMLDKWEGTFNN